LDGAGVRYGIFMQGCPLRCAYCHNPDTWTGSGTTFEPEELVRKVARYKPYFGEKGGVTFSGGEPLLQAEFIRECIPLLKENDIGYIVDTSGAVELSDAVKDVLLNSESVILDLKFRNDEEYLRYTGADMSKTRGVLEFLETHQKPVLVRTVVVPGINDTEEILEGYVDILKGFGCVRKYELLAFHTMGFFKYEKMGVVNPFAEKKALDEATREKLQRFVDEKMNM